MLWLLSSCRTDQLLIVRPTSTEVPAASATATLMAEMAAIAQTYTALEATTAKVND